MENPIKKIIRDWKFWIGLMTVTSIVGLFASSGDIGGLLLGPYLILGTLILFLPLSLLVYLFVKDKDGK